MSILIWLFLAFVFIKCVGWVLAPFQRTRYDEDYEDYEDDRPIEFHYHSTQITDSFNADYSSFKEGTYHGAEKEETSSTTDREGGDYFDTYFRRR